MEKIQQLKQKKEELEAELLEINFKIRTDAKNRGKYLLSKKERVAALR